MVKQSKSLLFRNNSHYYYFITTSIPLPFVIRSQFLEQFAFAYLVKSNVSPIIFFTNPCPKLPFSQNSRYVRHHFFYAYAFHPMTLFLVRSTDRSFDAIVYPFYKQAPVRFFLEVLLVSRMVRSLQLRLLKALSLLCKQLFFLNFANSLVPLIIEPFPLLSWRYVKRGRERYPVPYTISYTRRKGQASKMFGQAVREYKTHSISYKVTRESFAILLNQSSVYFDLLSRYYSSLITNRIYMHFRW